MPVVVRLARHLYLQRVEEIKTKLAQDQQEFNQLATEIHAIQSGEWDSKLKPDPTFVPVKNTSDTDKQPETTPMTEQDDSGTKENKPTLAEKKDASVDNEAVDPTLILQENRLKRTSSDIVAQEPHQLKRSRLGDSNQEDQVLSTAISQAPVDTGKHALEQEKGSDQHSSCAELKEMSIAVGHPKETDTMDVDIKESSSRPVDDDNEQPMQALEPITQAESPSPQQQQRLPKIIIPQASEPCLKMPSTPSSKSYYAFDATKSLSPPPPPLLIVSPISKFTTHIQTPEDDDLTGSESNTPTTTLKRNSEQRQKAWQKNINLLWQEIANHKNGTMFMNPIKKSWAPMYDQVVKQPLYLKTIKNRVRDGIVKTTTEFERDIVLMLTNSLMYNREGTEMYLMAQEMLEDVREQLRLFKSADSFSASFWESEQ
ncbi:hypothetical protein PS15p_207343 [Mucor circinelloides]